MGKRVFGTNLHGLQRVALLISAFIGVIWLSVFLNRSALASLASDLHQSTAPKTLPVSNSSHDIELLAPTISAKAQKIFKDVKPNANWYNRPESIVVPKDDYMGNRPNVDTIANLTRLVEKCRGSYERLERMPYVHDCLKYLELGEADYFYIPQRHERASKQPPRIAEYLNSDGHSNTLTRYPSYIAATALSIGQCDGPVIPYHVYWSGPATWRVELFLKSYFYTQNIPCARLFMWLDYNFDPQAVDKMLHHDPLFRRFLPLVDRGDITLMTWRCPSRVPLPKSYRSEDNGYYRHPGTANTRNETLVADNIIRDGDDQDWLVLDVKQMTIFPQAISDAVRFVVLHKYGGLYCDMDVLMLRDMRPLLIGREHSFAERWGAHAPPGDYNTAIMSLSANSSLSSYLLHGGSRMGLNFHPRIIGSMAVKDGRNRELLMMETALFDPIWTAFDHLRRGPCTVPCLTNYAQAFKGRRHSLEREWDAFNDTAFKIDSSLLKSIVHENEEFKNMGPLNLTGLNIDLKTLRRMKYDISKDAYPPTNRTLQHFFRGAFTYHVHNQVINPWLCKSFTDLVLTYQKVV